MIRDKCIFVLNFILSFLMGKGPVKLSANYIKKQYLRLKQDKQNMKLPSKGQAQLELKFFSIPELKCSRVWLYVFLIVNMANRVKDCCPLLIGKQDLVQTPSYSVLQIPA